MEPKVPQSDFEIDLFRQFIEQNLGWPQLVHISESPDEQGRYTVVMGPPDWPFDFHNFMDEPRVKGLAWLADNDGRVKVLWSIEDQPYTFAQDNEAPFPPVVTWPEPTRA